MCFPVPPPWALVKRGGETLADFDIKGPVCVELRLFSDTPVMYEPFGIAIFVEVCVVELETPHRFCSRHMATVDSGYMRVA